MGTLSLRSLFFILPMILTVGCAGKHRASEINQMSAKQGLSDRLAGDFIYPLGFEIGETGNVTTSGMRGKSDYVIIHDSISAFLLDPDSARTMPTLVEKRK